MDWEHPVAPHFQQGNTMNKEIIEKKIADFTEQYNKAAASAEKFIQAKEQISGAIQALQMLIVEMDADDEEEVEAG